MMDKNQEDKEYGSLKEVSKRSYGLRGLKRVIREKGSTALLKLLSMVLNCNPVGRTGLEPVLL
ncbi:MAG: hypothetical protein ACYSW8_33510 [Planctomycetota bacterium]|jgi:hypothetical protein